MKISTETKKGVICLALGLGLSYLIVYLLKRDKERAATEKETHIITDESISVAVNAYKSGMDAGESQADLDEINRQLKEEYGITVQYKPIQNKFVVRDVDGKKVKEV